MSKVYKDQIPPESGRKYTITDNGDGTFSIADVTEYVQAGSSWAAADANMVVSETQEAKAVASAAMPKTGGTFTGTTYYNRGAFIRFLKDDGGHYTFFLDDNGSMLLRNSSADGTVTNYILSAGSDGTVYVNGVNIATLNTTASNAMPKSGGVFTGNVVAYGTNRADNSLRNIFVVNSSWAGQATNYITMMRK